MDVKLSQRFQGVLTAVRSCLAIYSSAPLPLITSLVAMCGLIAACLALMQMNVSAVAAPNSGRSYLVYWFVAAGHHYDNKEDCPAGNNSNDFLKTYFDLGAISRMLSQSGNTFSDTGPSFEEAQKNNKLKEFGPGLAWGVTYRGRRNGVPANVYTDPESAPDPRIKTGVGKIGYGFNLDGQNGPLNFIDPETKEAGVDNNAYRAIACISYLNAEKPPARKGNDVGLFQRYAPIAKAQLLEISGIDSTVDDPDVVVTDSASLDTVPIGPDGLAASGGTYRKDLNPRFVNRFHGRIKDGILYAGPVDLNIVGSPQLPAYRLKKAYLRLRFQRDGRMAGYIGGYQPWMDIYWIRAIDGFNFDGVGANVVGLYYALKKLADGPKSPTTGRSDTISATYYVEAKPVTILPPPRSVDDRRGANR